MQSTNSSFQPADSKTAAQQLQAVADSSDEQGTSTSTFSTEGNSSAQNTSAINSPQESITAGTVPDYVLRAIYPERYAHEPAQKSKSEVYAEALHNVNVCKKETYRNIIVPFLEEQRRKGIPACPGELGST